MEVSLKVRCLPSTVGYIVGMPGQTILSAKKLSNKVTKSRFQIYSSFQFDKLVIETLINSPDYSPLYKMVLKDTHSSNSVCEF